MNEPEPTPWKPDASARNGEARGVSEANRTDGLSRMRRASRTPSALNQLTKQRDESRRDVVEIMLLDYLLTGRRR